MALHRDFCEFIHESPDNVARSLQVRAGGAVSPGGFGLSSSLGLGFGDGFRFGVCLAWICGLAWPGFVVWLVLSLIHI